MRNMFWSSSSCKTKQIYLVRDHRIMTLDSNQNLINIQKSYVVMIEDKCTYPILFKLPDSDLTHFYFCLIKFGLFSPRTKMINIMINEKVP